MRIHEDPMFPFFIIIFIVLHRVIVIGSTLLRNRLIWKIQCGCEEPTLGDKLLNVMLKQGQCKTQNSGIPYWSSRMKYIEAQEKNSERQYVPPSYNGTGERKSFLLSREGGKTWYSKKLMYFKCDTVIVLSYAYSSRNGYFYKYLSFYC